MRFSCGKRWRKRLNYVYNLFFRVLEWTIQWVHPSTLGPSEKENVFLCSNVFNLRTSKKLGKSSIGLVHIIAYSVNAIIINCLIIMCGKKLFVCKQSLGLISLRQKLLPSSFFPWLALLLPSFFPSLLPIHRIASPVPHPPLWICSEGHMSV